MSCKKKVDEDYTYIKAEKALTEDIDYFIDYTKTFALVDPVDSIAEDGSSWALTGDGTQGLDDFNEAITRCWVSGGGRIGNVLRLTNTVLTVGGRTHVRLIVIKIVNRLAQLPVEEAAVIEDVPSE